ncbi:MAG: DUF554 domain-containing protein [Selenomonadaceae bacterium]|nr:DUF554 domain-containing protein [Selenomonadaceae bacterium]MBQ7723502.1 DUF554 domain-containing protein [Selenomonadaceae bacterium]
MTEFHFAGVGTLINVAGIILGGLIGLGGGKFLTEKIQHTLQEACALAVIFLGASGALKNLDTMLLIASLIGGGFIGAIIDIDGKFERLGIWLRSRSGNDGDAKFVDAFVTASLTVCIGAMAVIGAINDRLLHDATILIAKSALDMIIILVMTASLGKGCIFSCVSVGIFQGAITFLAGFLEPIMTEIALANLSSIGNVLIFGVGVNLLFPERKISVANLLPALIIACLWR